MKYRVNGPVLMPFCSDMNALLDVVHVLKNVDVYLYPMYEFWKDRLTLQTIDVPTKETFQNIYNKILNNYNNIEEGGEYLEIFSHAFNHEITALTLDRISQIKFSKKERKVITFIVSKLAEKQFTFNLKRHRDAIVKHKNVVIISIQDIVQELILGINNIGMFIFSDVDVIKIRDLDVANVKILNDLREEKFGSIMDYLPNRQTKLYNLHYLGAISALSGNRETLKSWRSRILYVCKNNLLHNAYTIIKKYPVEDIERLNKYMKQARLIRLEDGIYKKEGLESTRITKKINMFY